MQNIQDASSKGYSTLAILLLRIVHAKMAKNMAKAKHTPPMITPAILPPDQ